MGIQGGDLDDHFRTRTIQELRNAGKRGPELSAGSEAGIIDRYVAVVGEPAQEWTVDSEIEGGRRYLEPLAAELKKGAQTVAITATLAPASGMSSSAALLVAGASGLEPDLGGKPAALLCQRAEQQATGVLVGVMDQFAAALGRKGYAVLLDCESLAYELVPFPDDIVIAVVDSGSEVARVRGFKSALEAGDRRRLGELLNASHASLRDDFEVSVPAVDVLVDRAQRTSGCLGARIMGSGFGGTILALLEPDSERAFSEAMGDRVTYCKTATGAWG